MPKSNNRSTMNSRFSSRTVKNTNSLQTAGMSPTVQGLTLDGVRNTGRVTRTVTTIALGAYGLTRGIIAGVSHADERAAAKAAKAAKKAAKK